MPPVPNKSLREMLDALRMECGHSTNVAHGLNDREAMVYLLDRVQRDLWEDYDWPELMVERDVTLYPHTRFYAYPADLQYDDITHAWLLFGTTVCALHYGITPEDFTLYNSSAGQEGWPALKWRHNADDGTFEVWPIPNDAATSTDIQGTVRFRGTKSAQPLLADDDMATLPWRLIVLSAAAEVLAKEEDPAAQTKAQRAAAILRRLRVRASAHKSGPFVIGGGHPHRTPRVGLDYIPLGYGSGPRRL